MIVNESSMDFILSENTYKIDQDYFYNSKLLKGVKDCDFIMYKENQLLFLEAKTNAPKQLDEYIVEISQKFRDSLLVYIAVIFNRKNTQSTIISKELNKTHLLKINIKLVLVIKNIAKQYLVPIRDALNKELRCFNSAFSIEENVIVLNEEQARSKGLVT